MSRATPEEAFAEARAAMERGDWEGFCACLDAETLLRIAENGVGRLLAGGPETGALLAGLCREHAVPDAGTKAWATRRSADGHTEGVGFVRKKGEWYIRPLAKRPPSSITDWPGSAVALPPG